MLINSAECAVRAGALVQADERLQERVTRYSERHHWATPRQAWRLRAPERHRTTRVSCVALRAADHTRHSMRASAAAACTGSQKACAASEWSHRPHLASARGSCTSSRALSDGASLRLRGGTLATARLPRAPERSSTAPVRPGRRSSGTCLSRSGTLDRSSFQRRSADATGNYQVGLRSVNTDVRSEVHGNATCRRRNALATTETELILMAAAAMIGLSSNPKNGYSNPAAIGTPRAL